MWSSFWNGLSDIFLSLWTIMPAIGNIPNILATIIISILFIYWTGKLISYKKNNES